MTRHDPIFLSHGAPYLPLVDHPASRFLRELSSYAGTPKAIVVVSAHFETRRPTFTSGARNTTIHDFRGFPPALYELTYTPPGAPNLAAKALRLLGERGIEGDLDGARGLDHGAWVPLILAYPDAAIPVIELSVQPAESPAYHYAVGQALAPLANEGVLVLASGSYTHNLHEFFAAGARGNEEPAWVTEFADWFDAALSAGDIDSLFHYRERAPFAVENHPTEEHLLPLFVALGAAGVPASVKRLHQSTDRGVLRLDAFAFGKP
jgi:4,5-DOPA dioxygenase extradiol